MTADPPTSELDALEAVIERERRLRVEQLELERQRPVPPFDGAFWRKLRERGE